MKPSVAFLACLGTTLSAMPAFAAAQTPSISGNAWVAVAILLALVALIVLTVFGSLGLQRRDKQRGTRDDSFGLFGNDDD